MSNSINRLPTGPLATIGSFLSEKDLSPNFSVANKAFNAAAKDARLIYHYPEIQSFERDSYVGRIAARLPLIDTDEGRVELVRRVRQIAEEHLGANLDVLQDDDWQTLNIHKNTPVSDFSYKLINMANTIIKDRLLLKDLVEIPLLHGLIQVGNSLSQNAAILRNWLVNIPNDFELGLALSEAVEIGNLEIVQAFLQTDRAIDPDELGWALSEAVEIGNLEIVQAILQSGHAIDPERLGLALSEAAEIGNLEIIQAILESGHAIDPEKLGSALSDGVEIGNLEIVRAILQSEHAIDPEKLGKTLAKAVKIGNLEIIQAFLKSGREIASLYRMLAASKLISIGHLSNSLNQFWQCPFYLKPLCALYFLAGGAAFSGEKVIHLAKSTLGKCRARSNEA